MKTILYARVSTSDQTIQHQQTQAEAAGFRFTDVIIDDGVSGVSTKLREREGGKRLFDMLRAGDVLVVRWVDRLGRDYQDVSDNIRHFMRQGVIVKTVINGMVFDGSTTDPMQLAVRDSLIAFMAALSQAQAEATKEARAAGIKHARETDQKKYRGRKPTFNRHQAEQVWALLELSRGVSDIARETGLQRQTVYRLRDNRADAVKALELWEG